MDFTTSLIVAASGMRAQSDRMKIIAENIANANSTSPTPGGDPYRRKIATVKSDFDRELGATLVTSGKPVTERQRAGRNHGHARGAAFLRSRSHRDGCGEVDADPHRRPVAQVRS